MASQTLAVIAIVAVAAGFLALRLVRTLRQSKAKGCGSDDCGCGH